MYKLINDDCINWISEQQDNSITGVVTDPPYSFKEYDAIELEKKRKGKGGIWRLPPAFDGSQRAPLPRFSVINDNQAARKSYVKFYEKWAAVLYRILVPGAHLIIATTPLLSDLQGGALRSAGFERRGEIVRLVTTFRGGDRPKGAEEEFSNISVLPRGAWEPWAIYRKPLSEGTIAKNLRKWKAGALRRPSEDIPFYDVIKAGKTPSSEKLIGRHPNQKPQSLMRKLTHAILPLGEGVILDPFAGSGSTLAAAEYNGLSSIGIERDKEFFNNALEAIPKLSRLGLLPLLRYDQL